MQIKSEKLSEEQSEAKSLKLHAEEWPFFNKYLVSKGIATKERTSLSLDEKQKLVTEFRYNISALKEMLFDRSVSADSYEPIREFAETTERFVDIKKAAEVIGRFFDVEEMRNMHRYKLNRHSGDKQNEIAEEYQKSGGDIVLPFQVAILYCLLVIQRHLIS